MTDTEILNKVKATFIYYENNKISFKTIYGSLDFCATNFKAFQKKYPNSTWVWQTEN